MNNELSLIELANLMSGRTEGSFARLMNEKVVLEQRCHEQARTIEKLEAGIPLLQEQLYQQRKELAAAPAEPSQGEQVREDAARFNKLLGWMSSNVTEGWDEVCRVVPVELLERVKSLLCSYMSTLEDRAFVRCSVEELRALLEVKGAGHSI